WAKIIELKRRRVANRSRCLFKGYVLGKYRSRNAALYRKCSINFKRKGLMMYDFLIVGCGFAGAVLAERLANAGNKKVLIIDKRNHIAGNAYDFYDEHGILVHKYGPHIFHTNSKD